MMWFEVTRMMYYCRMRGRRERRHEKNEAPSLNRPKGLVLVRKGS